MNRLIPFLLAAFLALPACAPAEQGETAPAESAEMAIPPQEHPDTADWSDLFAADLSNTIGADTIWTFTDGVLTASEDQNLYTQEVYDNFVLDLEYQTAEGTNSGVIVYASDLDNWTHYSLEIQIADSYAPESTDPPTMFENGAVFGHLAPTEQRVNAPGEWNRMTITCRDTLVWVMINGATVTELNMAEFTSGETNPDGSEIPEWLSVPLAELPTRGHIGVQGKHAGAPIYFRNLKVKTIE